jgi:hypothetical protein
VGVLLKPSEDFTSGVRPDNFGTNATFVHFLQQIIGKYGPDTVQLKVDAESIENGTLYVVDERALRPEDMAELVLPVSLTHAETSVQSA